MATDYRRYYALMQQAGEQPEEFAKANLWADRPKLDDEDFKHMAALQLSIRNHDREGADRELAGFRTRDQVVKDTLNGLEIDPAPKDGTPLAAAVSELHRMLDRRVAAAETPGADGKVRKVTGQELQEALDSLLSQDFKTKGSFWSLYMRPGSGRVGSMTVSDVPTSDRKLIEAELKRRGRPVTDSTVLDFYLEMGVK